MRCQYCMDTGSMSGDLEGYLDCGRCDVATQRSRLNGWAFLQGIKVSPADLWVIYQRGKSDAIVELNELNNKDKLT